MKQRIIFTLTFLAILLFSTCEKDPETPIVDVSETDFTLTPLYTTADASAKIGCVGSYIERAEFLVSENEDMKNPFIFSANNTETQPPLYSANATGLSAKTTYYCCFKVINSCSYKMLEVHSFETKDFEMPTVTTNGMTNIEGGVATCSGTVNANGGLNLTARGVCWSTSQNSTIANSHTTNGTGTGSFTSNLTNLSVSTTYYAKAYATNSKGTSYGDECSFTTTDGKATVTTNAISNPAATTATCGGNVTLDGGFPVTARGVCWSKSTNPTTSNSHSSNGTGTGSFTSSLTSLSTGTTYYVRAYATNSKGTSYGTQRSFTTTNGKPTVTTNTISSITGCTATCGGSVTSDGGFPVTARGVCWSTSQNPTISGSHTTNGSGTGSFTSSITGLTVGTTYYVRAYATNSQGTSYGAQRSFIASNCTSVTDIDGNTYTTVQIGDQCWMKENLRTTRYANGTTIALGSSTSSTVAYRYGSSSYVSTYGYLYNWKAVMGSSSSSSSNPSGVQGICPTGWHVPSDAEWTELTNFVSSQSQYLCTSNSSYIAKALASTTYWNTSTNTCAVGNTPTTNNATGFSALPGGGYYGSFYNAGNNAYFWSATQGTSHYAYNRNLNYGDAGVYRNNANQTGGFSVRCVRD